MDKKVFCDNCKFCFRPHNKPWKRRCDHPDNRSIRYTPEHSYWHRGNVDDLNGLNNCKDYRFSIIALIPRFLSKLF